MASANFAFGAQAPLVPYAATAAEVVDIELASQDGVIQIEWAVETTDENGDTWAIAAPTSISGTTITAPSGTGKAARVRCKVNGGDENAATGGHTAIAKIYIAPEPIAYAELNESNSNYGVLPLINAAVRGTVNPSAPSGTDYTITIQNGRKVSIRDVTTEILSITESSGTFISSPPAALFGISSGGVLAMQCAAGSHVGIQENATEVCRFHDDATEAIIEGQGVGGTRFASVSGPLRLRGNNIELYDGATAMAAIYDATTWTVFDSVLLPLQVRLVNGTQEEVAFYDTASGATNKNAFKRLARATITTATTTAAVLIPTALLPTVQWTGRIAVEWVVTDTTSGNTSAGGTLHATIQQTSASALTVKTAANDQRIGTVDDDVAGLDTSGTNHPQVVIDGGGNIAIQVITTNTNNHRVAAWADFKLVKP